MLINLLQRHHLWIFIFLSGLCGLALGHLGATSIGILANPSFIPIQFLQSATEKTDITVPLTDYQVILSRDIFNSAGGTQGLNQIAAVQPENATPTKTASKWALVGTVSGGDSPLAILSSAGETSTYRLNEELPDGGTLTIVERKRVELRYPDGQTQILELPQDTPLPTSVAKPQSRPQPQRQESSDQDVESLGENRWLIPATVAEDARSNIGNLLTQAQAVPYLEGDQTTGFLIRMIQSGSLIAKLGLEKGDILREVNGVSLNSPEKALQVFGQLRQAKQISISLERRGKAMTFAYEIR